MHWRIIFLIPWWPSQMRTLLLQTVKFQTQSCQHDQTWPTVQQSQTQRPSVRCRTELNGAIYPDSRALPALFYHCLDPLYANHERHMISWWRKQSPLVSFAFAGLPWLLCTWLPAQPANAALWSADSWIIGLLRPMLQWKRERGRVELMAVLLMPLQLSSLSTRELNLSWDGDWGAAHAQNTKQVSVHAYVCLPPIMCHLTWTKY